MKNKSFWGSLVATSIGIYLAKSLSPMDKRRMLKTARRATSNIKDGISFLWE